MWFIKFQFQKFNNLLWCLNKYNKRIKIIFDKKKSWILLKFKTKSTQFAKMKFILQLKNQLTNFLTAATTFLALMPNRSNNTFDGPERGMSVTASFLTTMSLSSATADKTASPKPPRMAHIT